MMIRAAQRIAAFAASRTRVENHRFLYWSVYYPFNFGDWIGPYLYVRMTGQEPVFRLPSPYLRDTVTMAAGSILGAAKSNAVVWGCGILRSDQRFERPWRTLAVRGPRSRDAFLRQGYDCPETYGDPGILLPRVYQPRPAARRYALGIVPHFRDFDAVMAATAGLDDVLVVDVRHPIEQVVDRITSCDRVASSSLHGIITAHAYGVPALWVKIGHESGDLVKYEDYFRSAGIDPYRPAEPRWDDLRWLEDGIERTVVPDLAELQASLLEVCPFGQPAPRS